MSEAEAEPTIKNEDELPDHCTDRTLGHSLPRTQLRVFLAATAAATDPTSGLHLGAAALALRYFLPLRDLQRSLRSQQVATLSAAVPSCSSCSILVSGSSVEQLSVPPYCVRTASGADDTAAAATAAAAAQTPQLGPIVNTADQDVMYVDSELAVSPRFGHGMLYLDGSGATHPGYFRVGVNTALAAAVMRRRLDVQVEELVDETGAARHYLSSDFYMSAFIRVQQSKIPDRLQGVQARHGPALNSILAKDNRHLDWDTVRALPLDAQIPAVARWVRRLQNSATAWPPAVARRKILRHLRPHVVPTGHPASARRDLEWRLSFSAAERCLAVCLRPEQRKVYIVVKAIQKCFLKVPKVLVTYHLKTLMFWQLEETPDPRMWREEHLFARVLDILDRLGACLNSRNIPSYFVPENNLISSESPDDIHQVNAIVQNIRRHPLRTIYDLDSSFQFAFSPTQPLLHYHAPFLERVAAGDLDGIPATLAECLVHQARDGIAQNWHTVPRCAELLQDAWQIQQSNRQSSSRPTFDHWLQLALVGLCLRSQKSEDKWIEEVFRNAARDESQSGITDYHVQLISDKLKSWQSSPFLDFMQEILSSTGNDQLMRRIIDEFSQSQQPHAEQSQSLLFLLSAEIEQPASTSESGDQTDPQTTPPPKDPGGTGSRRQQLLQDIHDFVTTLYIQTQKEFDDSDGFVPAFLRRQASAGVPYVLSSRSRLQESLLSDRLAGGGQTPPAAEPAPPAAAADCHLVESLDWGAASAFAGARDTAASVRSTFTPVLTLLGFLISGGQRLFIERAASVWTPLTQWPAPLGAAGAAVTYDLREAPAFLASLPGEIRALLRLTGLRVGVKELELLVRALECAAGGVTHERDAEPPVCVATFADDWDLFVQGWRESECGGAGDDDAAAVLKVCAVRMLGGAGALVRRCLGEIQDGDTRQSAEQILGDGRQRYPNCLFEQR